MKNVPTRHACYVSFWELSDQAFENIKKLIMDSANPDFKPKNCEIILNYDCNAKCRFCYQPDEYPAKASPPMPFAKAAQALYKGRQNGCWVAYLIGGEITLRNDLPKIIHLAKNLGYLYIQVMSNAIKLADYAYAKKLVSSGANIFRISMHGYNAGLHDRLTGVPGSFRKALQAFENIKKLGAEITVNIALNRYNYKTVDRWLELISGKLGITDFNIIFPHYTGMMAEHARELKVSLTQALPYLRRALESLTASGAEIESPVFINFCPCNLPEAVHLMTEWEKPSALSGDEPLFHLDGSSDRIYDMKERFRAKNKSCSGCVYDSRCMGFEKWYSDLFGSGEFKPVIKPAVPLRLAPSFKRLTRALALINPKRR